MRIQYQRTGGFAGIKLAGEVDEHMLSEAERTELHRLLEEAGLSGSSGGPMLVSSNKPQPDRFHYRLVITDDNGKEKTLNVDEAALTASLDPLISFLSDQVRKNRAAQ